MKKLTPLHLCLVSLVIARAVLAAPTRSPDEKTVYKAANPTSTRELHMFYPSGTVSNAPAILFFGGGGWASQSPSQFYAHATHFSALGIVCIPTEYRTRNTGDVSPFGCVEDANSAMRYVRTHAEELGIDSNRVVAAGASAGGHVAAATAHFPSIMAAGEDAAIRTTPDLMVLFNPVTDTTETGFGADRFDPGEDPQDLSLPHHITASLPPGLAFHGTADTTVAYTNSSDYAAATTAAGNRFDLIAFPGRDHGFFNDSSFRPSNSDIDYDTTIAHMTTFLQEFGYLTETPQPQPPSADSGLLLYEPFDYTAGADLNGRGHATQLGFDDGSSWAYGGLFPDTVDIPAGGMTFGALRVRGNKARYVSTDGGTENIGITRDISFSVSSGTLWTSWLQRSNRDSVTSTGRGLSFWDTDRKFETFAKRNSSANGHIGFRRTQIGSSAVGATTKAEDYLVVGKFSGIGTSSQEGRLWIVTLAEFNAIADGGVTEAELDAGVHSDRKATVTDITPATLSESNLLRMTFVDLTTSGSQAVWFDELRVGRAIEDVIPLPDASKLIVDWGGDYVSVDQNFGNTTGLFDDTFDEDIARQPASGYSGGIFYAGHGTDGNNGNQTAIVYHNANGDYLHAKVTPGANSNNYALYVWAKSNFLNGNDTGNIQFRADDPFAFYAEVYRGNTFVTAASARLRWVFKQGASTYFISEEQVIDIAATAAAPDTHSSGTVRDLTWYQYDPVASVKTIGAQTTPPDFRNITAVGIWTSAAPSGASVGAFIAVQDFEVAGYSDSVGTVFIVR